MIVFQLHFKVGNDNKVKMINPFLKRDIHCTYNISTCHPKYKISALEIERELLAHDHIDEVAIIGVEDDVWGESICMIGVLSDSNLDLDAIRYWARDRLASYKLPTRLIRVDAIPRNAMGKVNKKTLKQDLIKPNN